ncbi:histidine kinase [Fibrella sp. HMF5335]|uniref:Histidine kinase n=1 Tax=Fibrella rubiginis TaxID=2817060 RepID=A0A939GD15_9BACT|nr:7TM diverse intracellular signaling domain-containing protein [Fibrella rubiginis]MBO0936709.1 histidine kinase [Fibrella rubiginis]
MIRIGKSVIVLVLLLLAARPHVYAQATDVVALTPTDDLLTALRIESSLSVFIDSLHHRTVRDIQVMPFSPVGRAVPNAGYTSEQARANPIWLRFRVQNATNKPIPLFVRVNFWCFESLQLFVTQTPEKTSAQTGSEALIRLLPPRVSRAVSTTAVDSLPGLLAASPVVGWRTPVAARPVHNRHFFFPVTVPAGADYTVYLRTLKVRGAQVVPVSLLRQAAYETWMQRDYLFWGGVLMTLLFVSLMSFFFFITTRDPIYWTYLLCVICLIGFMVINNGFLNQFAPSVQFWLPRQNCYFLFPLLLFYSNLVFVRTFLPLKKTPLRWLHRLSAGVLLAGLFCVLMLVVENWVQLSSPVEMAFLRLFTLFYWLPMPVMAAYVVMSLYRRYYRSAAWLYLVAITPFYILNFGQVVANFGLIPTYRPLVNFDIYAATGLFEVLALTFGLAYRYKLMRDNSDRLLSSQREQERTTFATEVQTLAQKNSLLEERERIARDLHDNVGAQLAFMITSLLHIGRQVEQQPIVNGKIQAEQLRTIVGYARDAIRTLRETIWAIQQERFTLAEFEERLNQYVNRYVQQTNGLDVVVEVEGDSGQPLTSAQVLNLFRIVQEALSNVVQHARATEATVRLQTQPNGTFCLTIQDNGQGLNFSPDDADNGERHYGISNMKRRTEELGASFRIYANAGTVVEARREAEMAN